jgi:hypothetical protein
MSSTNGALTVYRPTNRIEMALHATRQQAEFQARRREEVAQDELEAQELAHETQERLLAAERAIQKYLTAKDAVRALLEERRVVEEDAKLCEAEKFLKVTALNQAIDRHRAAMVGCMVEFAGQGANVEPAVSKDMASLETEVYDKRGLHARTQARDDKGRFGE